MLLSEEKVVTKIIPLKFQYQSEDFKGVAEPVNTSCSEDVCFELNIKLNGKDLGIITCDLDGKWKMPAVADQEFIDTIGEKIFLWYE